ncbi:alpha/beta hydrolase [Thermocoleostomius sinensis]|uniref:Alpha/beta fold hydrolase n=1 Tax=Thermocoleostomius sinensis A174 TaxID=2016057 RepID=A0A9E9C7S9_9CYAN|nr:alpha/beta fold hydrolase [Thermocoleostomius sinensis]WAL59553.1 alpha/beta fold hydrolase [Thermocoleostomius sinensis A174]
MLRSSITGMSLILKLSLLFGGLLSTVYLAICGVLYLRQTRMIFFPSPYVEVTPAGLGLDYEELWLPVAADTVNLTSSSSPSSSPSPSLQHLHGWWIPAIAPETGVLLYLHGNGFNIGANLSHAARFHQLGFSVLLMDYRGYGRSEGEFPHEAQVYEDAETMWHYLVETRQISPDRIIVYGHSLGGAIAIDLAARHPQLAGLIVDGSFTSMRHMVALSPMLRFFPIDWLLTQQFNSLEKIRMLQIPILFIHGTADAKVPASMSQTLHEAAPQSQLYLVPDAGHNDVAERAGTTYLETVQQFAQQAIRSDTGIGHRTGR